MSAARDVMYDGAGHTEDALASLVHAAQGGDAEAFARIVEQTSGRIFALCLRLCGNEHDARDVMQDTYLRAFRSLSTFRYESSFSTWLYRIAANCSSTHLGRRSARRSHSIDLDIEAIANVPDRSRLADPALAVESIDDRVVLIAALQELPFSLRSVVVLADVYDLTHEEIAHELGISRTAVKVRLHRGRKKLHDTIFSPPPQPEVSSTSPAAVPRGRRKRPIPAIDRYGKGAGVAGL